MAKQEDRLFIGRIAPHKRVEDLILAYQRFRAEHAPRATLLLVGDYRCTERYHLALRELIERRAITGIRFTGQVSEEELEACFRAASVLVTLSAHEGLCLPVLEALAAGKPAITTRYNGAADFLGEGEYGITIDEPTDIQALADALQRLCDPKQQQQFCQRIEADRVFEQVSIRRHVAELIKIYRGIRRR